MSNIKKWKIFEEIVRKIYDISLSKYPTKIESDIKIKGKSSNNHQIDVLVQVFMKLINFKEIINCKHWKNKVTKLHVESINSIKEDVNAQKATIMSRKGFQMGAINYAKYQGINLYKILMPRELGVHTGIFKTTGWSNELVNVHVQLEAKTPEQLDKKFETITPKERYSELNIYNKEDKPISNIFDLIDKTFKNLQEIKEGGIKLRADFLGKGYIIKDNKKENVNFIEIHVQKRFIESEKKEYIKDTKLLIHDVVNDKMFCVEKPIEFNRLEEESK